MIIKKTLNIQVTQADVEQAIRERIKQEDPTIVVDEIVFAQKRTGKDSIAVKVEAHFAGDEDSTPISQEEEEEVHEANPEEEEAVKTEEEKEEEALDEETLKRSSLFPTG